MEAFFIATSVVALAEIGDKTQLLAFMLAAKFRRPWPIVWGILVATPSTTRRRVAGGFVTHWMGPTALRWILGSVHRDGRLDAGARTSWTRTTPPSPGMASSSAR